MRSLLEAHRVESDRQISTLVSRLAIHTDQRFDIQDAYFSVTESFWNRRFRFTNEGLLLIQ